MAVLSDSGTLGTLPFAADVLSRNPKPVMGSGDSWMTRAFGKDAKEVGDVVKDCSRCRYKRTVPSPSPIAKCDKLDVRAIEDTYSQPYTG